MKNLLKKLIQVAFGVNAQARQSADEQVRRAVESFYAAFNAHDFARAAEFTTDDWEHINPFGGRTRGREEVLEELRQVHSSFLKGVPDTVESMSVRLTAPSSAAVTVISQMGTYITPDGVHHENERHVRTFIVINRGGRWLVMQDQNTLIAS